MKYILKPCPFCGGTALFVGTSAEIDGDNNDRSIAVCCDFNEGGCGATGGYRETEEEAIEAWNRRNKHGSN